MPAGPDSTPVAGVDRLDRADHSTALDVVFEERRELRPGSVPELDDRRVAPAPLSGELLEPILRRLLGDSGTDGLEPTDDGVSMLPTGITERVADQVDGALLRDRLLSHGVDCLREAFQSVTERDQDILNATVLELRKHL